jgi:hypothetical protein
MNEHEKTDVAADAVLLWRSGVDIESLIKFIRERGMSQNNRPRF